MSAALVESLAESAKTAVKSRQPAYSGTAVQLRVSSETAQSEAADPHPLVPVFLIGSMALIGALAFVGSILIWLALRNSGVLAP
jgi:hypothetical protein